VTPADPVAAPPVALYVHIPFCVSLCPYCDFVVYAGAAARGPKARTAAFLDALHAVYGTEIPGFSPSRVRPTPRPRVP
jgi:oxygen-independent coproporphyrinogen-3 oxidase